MTYEGLKPNVEKVNLEANIADLLGKDFEVGGVEETYLKKLGTLLDTYFYTTKISSVQQLDSQGLSVQVKLNSVGGNISYSFDESTLNMKLSLGQNGLEGDTLKDTLYLTNKILEYDYPKYETLFPVDGEEYVGSN